MLLYLFYFDIAFFFKLTCNIDIYIYIYIYIDLFDFRAGTFTRIVCSECWLRSQIFQFRTKGKKRQILRFFIKINLNFKRGNIIFYARNRKIRINHFGTFQFCNPSRIKRIIIIKMTYVYQCRVKRVKKEQRIYTYLKYTIVHLIDFSSI